MQGPKKKRSRSSRLAGMRPGRLPLPTTTTTTTTSSRGGGRKLRLRVRPTTTHHGRGSREEIRILARSASEPALIRAPPKEPLISSSPPSPPPPPLERPHTCYDIFSSSSFFPDSSASFVTPSMPLPDLWKEAKVVVSVTVEGSPGPVKVMVRLGGTIDEAIAAVVEKYGREGRSPRLDRASADAFQLHHSHFCLQGLDKNDKIGEVGGRNFYLHKTGGASNGLLLRCDAEPAVDASGGESREIYGRPLGDVPQHHQFLAIVIRKLDKIGRRTKKIWRVITCDWT